MGSQENARKLRQRVDQLEARLGEKDEEIERMRTKLEDQESLLARRMQIVNKTMKERDELRKQNAELILKLAQVGRRQSISSSGSPSPPTLRSFNSVPSDISKRSPPPTTSPLHHSSPPVTSPLTSSPRHSPPRFLSQKSLKQRNSTPLPPTPEKKEQPKEDSDTDYSDMEDNDGEKRGRQKKPSNVKTSKPKPIVRGGKAFSPTRGQSPPRKVAFSDKLPSISEEGRGQSSKGRIANGSIPQSTPNKLEKMGRGGSPAPSGRNEKHSVSFQESGSFDSSMEMSPPVSPRKTPVQEGAQTSGKQRVKIAETGLQRSRSQESLDLSTLQEEAKDTLGDMNDVGSVFRSRINTVSTTSGKHREIGRKNSKQLKHEAAKLSERVPNIRRGQRRIYQELELFSPDMELRIREKICNAIGQKYGGLRRANRAATTIQTAYRQYKLKKRYEEIRKEASHMRRRALSMKDPQRRPSMIRKNRPNYRREVSAMAANDPLLRAKLLSREMGKERTSHTSGRTDLVVRQRSEKALLEGERKKESVDGVATCKVEEEKPVEMESVVCKLTLGDEFGPDAPFPSLTLEGVTVGESSTDPSETDGKGMSLSFSSDALLTSEGYQRPLSIFGVRQSISVEEGLRADEDRVISTLTQRPLTPGVKEKKMNLGIDHFNRKPTKGIQYLVKESVLPDDPQLIASFLACQCGLSKEKIGEFVGEINSEFHMAVLECLLTQMDMKEKPIDEALREFQVLFRMPGEAQKIDKIMQMFALEYFRFNKDGVIKSEDAAYMVSFAIMMLHTSLHNPSVKNRTTKKQWVSMNRGCNDGENFPEAFLLEIFDRIGKREFTTGHDHTVEVAEIERSLIGYQNASRLAIPQRKLVCRSQVSEIVDLTSRPSFKNRHRRILLVFSDQVIICKRKGGEQLEYRGSFSLLNAIAITFETHHYKNGIQIYSSHDHKAIFQCNCDNSDHRQSLLLTFENTISTLRDLESERIAELGTSITKTKEVELEGRRRLASRAGDLLSSTDLSKRDSRRAKRESREDFVAGVGDLVLSSGVTTNIVRRTSRSSGSVSPENRTSGGSHESGYDSQRTTPVASPSPTNNFQPRASITSAPAYLAPHQAPPTRSKSTEGLNRVLTIVPSIPLPQQTKFPSAEDISLKQRGKSKKKNHSMSAEKAQKPHKKSRIPSLSSPFRIRRGDRRASDTPKSAGRKRASSHTPSPPPSDLDLSTQSLGRASAYMVT